MYGIWKAKWVWRYRVKGQDYSEEDREYITRKRLKLSENHWKVCACVFVWGKRRKKEC